MLACKLFVNIGGIFMANTPESKLRANKRYHDKFELLAVRIPPEEKTAISEHAAASGESIVHFIRRAAKETIERDKQK